MFLYGDSERRTYTWEAVGLYSNWWEARKTGGIASLLYYLYPFHRLLFSSPFHSTGGVSFVAGGVACPGAFQIPALLEVSLGYSLPGVLSSTCCDCSARHRAGILELEEKLKCESRGKTKSASLVGNKKGGLRREPSACQEVGELAKMRHCTMLTIMGCLMNKKREL